MNILLVKLPFTLTVCYIIAPPHTVALKDILQAKCGEVSKLFFFGSVGVLWFIKDTSIVVRSDARLPTTQFVMTNLEFTQSRSVGAR